MMGKRPSTPEEKESRYFHFCRLRREGYPAEDIAVSLLGPQSSPKALYGDLRKEGFPVCQMCGAYSADETFCGEHLRKTEQKGKRGATDLGGNATKLPPAGDAEDLFREAIVELNKLVDPLKVLPEDQSGWKRFRALRERRHTLGWLEEYLQGEHIVSYSVEDRANAPVIYRDNFTAEEWREACEEQGVDPSTERIVLENISAIPYGAKKAPAEILVKLIGVYVLAGKPLEPLVEKLHHAPETVDWKKLENFIHGYRASDKDSYGKLRRGRHVDGMLDKLRLIATEVRGGTRRTGPFKELSNKEVEIARKIAVMSDELTRQEIYEELKELKNERVHPQRRGPAGQVGARATGLGTSLLKFAC
jgi:hypothetical protein